MSAAADKILEDALALPEDERRGVAEKLLASLAFEPDAEIEEAWNEEAARRAGEIERGEVETLDGVELIERLKARASRKLVV